MQAAGDDQAGWQAKQLMAETFALITRCDAAIPTAVKAGVPQQIVQYSHAAVGPAFPSSCKVSMMRSCVECLLQLTHGPTGKAAIREAGGIPVLAAQLGSDDAAVINRALHAFMGLTIDIDSKQLTLEVCSQHACGSAT